MQLLEQCKNEGLNKTAIAYNAAISACEKGLVPNKAVQVFDQMKEDGIMPTVVTFSALISAAEKGQQWKLALQILQQMKEAGHGANVIGKYSERSLLRMSISCKLIILLSLIHSLLCHNLGSIQRSAMGKGSRALS